MEKANWEQKVNEIITGYLSRGDGCFDAEMHAKLCGYSYEEKTISIHLPADAFAVYDENGKRYIDACTYQIFAGGSQPDQRSAELKKQRVLCAEVRSVRKYCIDETI